MMRPTHLLNDQVTVPNVPSESGRATSDELVIIFKLVTFFKKYSNLPGVGGSTAQGTRSRHSTYQLRMGLIENFGLSDEAKVLN